MDRHVDIVEITAVETHRLRRDVLRRGTPSDAVAWDGDDEVDTFHLGARDGTGELVATSSWLRRAHHLHPDVVAWQVRGMATAEGRRSSGIGGRLIEAGIERCAGAGAAAVWARSRSTAVSFYRRHGFEPIGDEYVDDTTALAHIDVLRPLRHR